MLLTLRQSASEHPCDAEAIKDARAPFRRHRHPDRPGTSGITFAPHRGTCIGKRCCRLHIEGDARQAETTKAGSTQKERSKERCITTYDAPLA